MDFSNIVTQHEIDPDEHMDFLRAKTILLQCQAPPTSPSTDDPAFLAKMYLRRREKNDVGAKALKLAIDTVLDKIGSSNLRMMLEWYFPEDFLPKITAGATFFRFLELPLEMQHIVFQHHFKNSETRICLEPKGIEVKACSWHAHLLLVSKSMYSAALRIFLRSRNLYVFLHKPDRASRRANAFSKFACRNMMQFHEFSHLKLNIGEFNHDLATTLQHEMKWHDIKSVTFSPKDFASLDQISTCGTPDDDNLVVTTYSREAVDEAEFEIPHHRLIELMKTHWKWFPDATKLAAFSKFTIKLHFNAIFDFHRVDRDPRVYNDRVETLMEILYNATTEEIEFCKRLGRKREEGQSVLCRFPYTKVGKGGEPCVGYKHNYKWEWIEV